MLLEPGRNVSNGICNGGSFSHLSKCFLLFLSLPDCTNRRQIRFLGGWRRHSTICHGLADIFPPIVDRRLVWIAVWGHIRGWFECEVDWSDWCNISKGMLTAVPSL